MDPTQICLHRQHCRGSRQLAVGICAVLGECLSNSFGTFQESSTVYMTHRKCSREGNGNPLQYSCLGNPVDRGAWWAALHEVSQSQIRLKQLSMHTCIGEGNGNRLQYSCLEYPRDGGTWWAATYGVAQSQTQMKWLSSSTTTIDLEKYRLEQGNIWKWTDPTLPSTAPEKFLDIFLLWSFLKFFYF